MPRQARSHGQTDATAAARRPPLPPAIKRNTLLLAVTQAFVGVGNQMVPALGASMVLRLLGSPALQERGRMLGVNDVLTATASIGPPPGLFNLELCGATPPHNSYSLGSASSRGAGVRDEAAEGQ
jgi:hypothetical protein